MREADFLGAENIDSERGGNCTRNSVVKLFLSLSDFHPLKTVYLSPGLKVVCLAAAGLFPIDSEGSDEFEGGGRFATTKSQGLRIPEQRCTQNSKNFHVDQVSFNISGLSAIPRERTTTNAYLRHERRDNEEGKRSWCSDSN